MINKNPINGQVLNNKENITMSENKPVIDRRSEHRDLVDQYYSVQFSKPGLEAVYQFRIRNISSKGICILIREDSNVLKHLQVGDILDMQFHPLEKTDPVKYSKTEIKHITKDDQGRFKGHYLVGLNKLEP